LPIAIGARAAAAGDEDNRPRHPFMSNAPIYAQGNAIYKHMHPAIQNNELLGVHVGLQELRDAGDADPEGNYQAYLDALLDKKHIAKNKFLPPGWKSNPARETDDDELGDELSGDEGSEGVGEYEKEEERNGGKWEVEGGGVVEEDEEWEDIEDDEDNIANFLVGNAESGDEGDVEDGASLSGSVVLEFDTVEEKERFEAMMAEAIRREEERKLAEE
jgi:hypothetical protein